MTGITFQKATKRQLPARIALDGPSGSGKTWSGLVLATELAGPNGRICWIDTERRSASLYADHFDFDTFPFDKPYDPAKLVDVIRAAEAEGYDVIGIDSLSHFWEGEGGTLDIVDKAANQSFGGNKYAGWSIGTPALRRLVDTMLDINGHLIVAMRAKMDYLETEKPNGKKGYEKVGMAPIMRAGIEYEFTLVGDLDLQHRLSITKSRCDVVADKVYMPGAAGDLAREFKAWLDDGEAVATPEQLVQLKAVLAQAPDVATANAIGEQIAQKYGKPVDLLQSNFEAAKALAGELLAAAMQPAEGGGWTDEPDAQVSASSEVGKPEDLDAGPTETGASAPTPSSTPVEDVPPGDGEATETPEDLLQKIEMAIKGLPRAAQPGCRTELNKTFGNLFACSIEELHGALEIIGGWPIGTEEPPPMTKDRPLSAKQRGVLAYAHGHGVNADQVSALGSLQRGTKEPRPLHELDDAECTAVTSLIDSVKSGEVVFETPNGVLIAKEVQPA